MIESPFLPPHSSGNDAIDVANPATGETVGRVSSYSHAQVSAAIDAAAADLQTIWPSTTRSQWLAQIANNLLADKGEFARIITLEQGKPLKESIAEVEYAAGFFSYFSRSLGQIDPHTVAGKVHGASWTVAYRPSGVAALITPWNFPLAMLAKKLSAAIGAGCASIIKPSELTPLSAIALANVAIRAGVPAARAAVVTGAPDPIGDVVCTHPAVRVISFTGSTAVGNLLQVKAAPYTKRLALELGGNAPFIVFSDADIESAADALIASKFRCAGQTCVCANRILVQETVHDAFTEAVIARVAKLNVGNGADPEADIGPLINRDAWDKVSGHIANAIDRGATRVFGDNVTRPAHDWGCYMAPTVLTGCTPDMLVFTQETFGPVVSISRFAKESVALSIANDTAYGLAGYVFTADQDLATHCAEVLQVGHLGVNTGAGPAPEAPFGGMKQSGFGREGGDEGLREYVEQQTIAYPS